MIISIVHISFTCTAYKKRDILEFFKQMNFEQMIPTLLFMLIYLMDDVKGFYFYFYSLILLICFVIEKQRKTFASKIVRDHDDTRRFSRAIVERLNFMRKGAYIEYVF